MVEIKNRNQTVQWSDDRKHSILLKNKHRTKETTETYEGYKRKREVNEKAIAVKRKVWQRFGRSMKKNAKKNPKLFNRVMSNLKKEYVMNAHSQMTKIFV